MKYLYGYLAVILATFISAIYIFTTVTIWTIVGAVIAIVGVILWVYFKLRKL